MKNEQLWKGRKHLHEKWTMENEGMWGSLSSFFIAHYPLFIIICWGSWFGFEHFRRPRTERPKRNRSRVNPKTFFSWGVKARGKGPPGLEKLERKPIISESNSGPGRRLIRCFAGYFLRSFPASGASKIGSQPGGSAILDEKKILQLIRDGYVDAYAELVREHHRKVLGYCLSTLLNRTDAEEAAQDIFVKAFRSLPKFKGDSSFSTWIYRITANHCLDVLRRRNRRRTVSWEGLAQEEGDRIHRLLSAEDADPSRLEDRQLADRILSTLPEDYRRILTLREQDGLEYQEIAEVLGCTLDAVKGRLARARKALQENLRPFRDRQSVYYYNGKKPLNRQDTKGTKNNDRKQ